MDGFDFGFSPDGEIIVDSDTHDIYKSQEDELKIQLSYNRIIDKLLVNKKCSNNRGRKNE